MSSSETDKNIDPRPEVHELLKALKRDREKLLEIQLRCARVAGYDQSVYYRYLHQSLKVFYTPVELILEIKDSLQSLMPLREMNRRYLKIVADGTVAKKFDVNMNFEWDKHALPIVLAYSFSRHLLDMTVRYADELDAPPQSLPEGWGTLLYLFNLR